MFVRCHWVRILLALIVLLPGAAGREDESPELLLRAGMHKELVEGDPSGAIELYQKVASNRNAPRTAVARALLQMGLCYEKIGDALARSAYRRLIENYPELGREVEVAKRRLEEMAKSSAAAPDIPSFDRIEMTARLYEPASLSPEGDRLAFTSDGCLWIMPVQGKVRPGIAGVSERLTKPMGAWGPLAWSGDGNWIAFNAGRSQLYVIPSAGGEPVRVDAGASRGGSWWDYAVSLSPDGTKLAYADGSDEEKKRVHVIPVAGGTPVPLPVERSRQPSFSPDGRWIACVTESWTSEKREGKPASTVRGALWIVSPDGGEAVRVGEVPGRARSPIWSPDGEMIAYLRDDGTTAYTRELRIVPIRRDGRSASPPTKLELPFVTPELLAGWTARNRIGILKSVPGRPSIYKVAAAGGRAAQISARYGDHPRWSPDASRVYFRDRGSIVWIPAAGGDPTSVPLQSAEVVEAVPGGSNQPSPDGSRIVLAGYLKRPGGISVNIWAVPADGGVPRQITDFPPAAHARFPCWSPDGQSIAFVRIDQGEGPNIYVVPADGGESRRLTSAKDNVAWARLAWSPDGTDIAYFSRDITLNLFNLRTGDSRVLAELEKHPGQEPREPGSMRHHEMAWSPEGRQIAYTHNGAIWVRALGNGQPVRVETGRAELVATYIDWSPDGEWLVFTGHTGFDRELHLMTDFMGLLSR